jgi:diguanylate cyclase (GGDEF)-like protein
VLALQDVTSSRAHAQTLVHQALHDPLTGLPNRVLLQDRLSQALAQVDRGYRGALLYLDLDRFKPINDSLGHPVGDRVLQEVANRLRDGVRQDDTVSRQGGDEFVLLLVRLADPRDAARVADKLIHAIEQPIHVDGNELRVSASIGIALFPQDGRETRDLTRQADSALYHAKQGGRGRYSYVTDIIGASAEERMRTEHDLRIALANGDFLLHWQPQVGLPGGVVEGVEALVRWRNGPDDLVQPQDFIPVAEETGLVVDIDEWVMRAACTQAMAWTSGGLPPVVVSVNVSLARLDADRLLAHVAAVLADTGLAPRWLQIEFKGAQLFAHGPRGTALVAALKTLGVRVAADDFASGHASLRELSNFAFDALKIDRDHVHGVTVDAPSRAVVEAILAIGRVMGYQVVATGVESDSQLEVLMALGCHHAQGRSLGHPVAADALAALLARAQVARGATMEPVA